MASICGYYTLAYICSKRCHPWCYSHLRSDVENIDDSHHSSILLCFAVFLVSLIDETFSRVD